MEGPSASLAGLRTWRRHRCWYRPSPHPLLVCGSLLPRSSTSGPLASMEGVLSQSRCSFLLDHRVGGDALVPGAAMMEVSLSGASQLWTSGSPYVAYGGLVLSGLSLVSPMRLESVGVALGGLGVLRCTLDPLLGVVEVRSVLGGYGTSDGGHLHTRGRVLQCAAPLLDVVSRSRMVPSALVGVGYQRGLGIVQSRVDVPLCQQSWLSGHLVSPCVLESSLLLGRQDSPPASDFKSPSASLRSQAVGVGGLHLGCVDDPWLSVSSVPSLGGVGSGRSSFHDYAGAGRAGSIVPLCLLGLEARPLRAGAVDDRLPSVVAGSSSVESSSQPRGVLYRSAWRVTVPSLRLDASSDWSERCLGVGLAGPLGGSGGSFCLQALPLRAWGGATGVFQGALALLDVLDSVLLQDRSHMSGPSGGCCLSSPSGGRGSLDGLFGLLRACNAEAFSSHVSCSALSMGAEIGRASCRERV